MILLKQLARIPLFNEDDFLTLNIWFLFVSSHRFLNSTCSPGKCLSRFMDEKELNSNPGGLVGAVIQVRVIFKL